jgi:hypothetical protein
MQVQLILKNDNGENQTFPVNVPVFKIGRAEGCNLRAGSPKIDPVHCVIHSNADSTVTVQDLGGENGTYVNGERISAVRTLTDGDELMLGKRTFVVSIQTEPALPAANPHEVGELLEFASAIQTIAEQEDIGAAERNAAAAAVQEEEDEDATIFEIRYGGSLVSVSKSKLFALARKGAVLPDDLITVHGERIFADSVKGIVFGDKASPVGSEAHVEVMPVTSEPIHYTPSDSGGDPFDVTSGDPAFVYTPPKEVTPNLIASVVVKTQEGFTTLKGNVEALKEDERAVRRIQIISAVIVCGLVSASLFGWYAYTSFGNKYGTVRVTGTVTLDGNPVEKVNVSLIPCCSEDGKLCDEDGKKPCSEDDKLCGKKRKVSTNGETNKSGNFTIVTRMAQSKYEPVKGALPGWYNVTFIKRNTESLGAEGSLSQTTYVIPEHYEKSETSGVKPVLIKSEKTVLNAFKLASTVRPSQFELASAPPPNTEFSQQPPPQQPVVQPVQQPEPQRLDPPPVRPQPTNPAPQPLPQQPPAPPPPPPPPPQPTSFEVAARGNFTDVRKLFDSKNVNQKDGEGMTALHHAASANTGLVTKFLITNCEADVNVKDNLGRTPLDVADTDEKRNILREYGGKLGQEL